MPRFVPLPLLLSSALLLYGCGLASARRSQDWHDVTDARLLRCCHVDNHGSGVLLAQDHRDLWILTNAELVSRVARVHVVDPATRRWTETTAWVAASGDGRVSELALLRAEPLPFLPPFATQLASPVADGSSREIDLLPVSVSDVPRAYRLPAVGRRSAGTAVDATMPAVERERLCVHGGLRQANSGTPIFDGDRLVGLTAPGALDAVLEDTGDDGAAMRRKVTGIAASTPQEIDAFLRTNGHGALADRLAAAH